MTPIPKNIYGVTKAAAEDLCQLFHRNDGLACIVLRTSRFFPEADDDTTVRAAFSDANHKVNEFLSRRVELEDVVAAHLLAAARAAARAAERAPALGFRRYIISAATPFEPEDMAELRVDAPAVVRRRVPAYEDVYARLGWTMTPRIDRVYVSERATHELGWRPRSDFPSLIDRLEAGEDVRSPLAGQVGLKGYHAATFADGL